MVEACFENCPHLLDCFAVQKWVEVFVDEFFDYADVLCESNEVILLLISKS